MARIRNPYWEAASRAARRGAWRLRARWARWKRAIRTAGKAGRSAAEAGRTAVQSTRIERNGGKVRPFPLEKNSSASAKPPSSHPCAPASAERLRAFDREPRDAQTRFHARVSRWGRPVRAAARRLKRFFQPASKQARSAQFASLCARVHESAAARRLLAPELRRAVGAGIPRRLRAKESVQRARGNRVPRKRSCPTRAKNRGSRERSRSTREGNRGSRERGCSERAPLGAWRARTGSLRRFPILLGSAAGRAENRILRKGSRPTRAGESRSAQPCARCGAA